MPKLQVNDDGTITFPLKGREPVTLEEPSMADLGWLTAAVQALDTSMPVIPPIRENSSPDEVEAFTVGSRARTVAIYDVSAENPLPYGHLVIETIKRFSDGVQDVDSSQLYGWAASPATVRAILEHFRAPLPGQAFQLPT